MNHKKKGILLFALLVVLFLAAIFGSDTVYNVLNGKTGDGNVIETSAAGFGGDVKVATTLNSDGAIVDIAILDCSTETPEIGQAAAPEVAKAIVEAQSTKVDGISGATLTSDAVKAAVRAATGETVEETEDATEAVTEAATETAATETESGETATESTEVKAPAKAGDVSMTAGEYEAEAQGFGGPVKVKVSVDASSILSVDISGDAETPTLGGIAVAELGDKIVQAQTPNVDAVSGATVTSAAIIAAATEALEKAGADVAVMDANRSDAAAEPEEKEEVTLNTDVVIVGAGGAGMTAAIKLKQAGKDVILLEKMPYAGGNTTKATGGMNAAETHYQEEQEIEDSVDQFVEDTMKGGHELNNEELVRTMAENSSTAIDWLDTIGAPLPKVSFSGGATNARIHAPEDGSGVGEFLVDAFVRNLDELGVEIMYNTKATELIRDSDSITGVKASSDTAEYTIEAKAVILATGGFGANEEMYTQYRPDLKGTVTTNAPGATGDGIIMAEEVGAALVDIEQIQLHPTVEQETSMLITESVRGDGAILVNQEGKRFTNELLTRDAVSAAELEQTGCYAYIIFDQHLRENLKAIEKYVKNGLTVESETIEGLAEKIDVEPEVLKETLDTWNQAVADQDDKEFGRDTGMDNDLTTPPYYAIKIAPGIHHTMGGVKINTNAEVIDTNGDVIPGLFAAGEVTGGVHGGNRLGGNAVADIVVFGGIAADSALAYCDGETITETETESETEATVETTAAAEGTQTIEVDGEPVQVEIVTGNAGQIVAVKILDVGKADMNRALEAAKEIMVTQTADVKETEAAEEVTEAVEETEALEETEAVETEVTETEAPAEGAQTIEVDGEPVQVEIVTGNAGQIVAVKILDAGKADMNQVLEAAKEMVLSQKAA